MLFDLKKLKTYPNQIGVYLMKDSSSKILYIGKAKKIKQRLSQYFLKKDLRPMVSYLIAEVEDINIIIVNTEKEALILENNLIKKHQPKYNILLKDDKTYVSLMVTHEKWPMIKLVRKKVKSQPFGSQYFGPYTNAKAARQTLDLLLKLFPLRQCSNNVFKNRTRPCLLYDIKKCLGPCFNKCTEEEYLQMVSYAISLLKGKNKEVMKDLIEKRQIAAKNLLFEKAQEYQQIIDQIKHVQQIQHVENLSAKECDALGIFQDKNLTIITKLMFREQKLIGSTHFSFTQTAEDEKAALESFLLQHYSQKEVTPFTILIPLNLSSQKELEDFFLTHVKKKIKIIHPKKGEKLALVKMAQKNALTLFKKEKETYFLQEKLLLNLQQILKFNNYPRHIICFDCAHLSETSRVASMVTFINGKQDKTKMKLFNIKTAQKGDVAALEEAIKRHLIKVKKYPDLLIVDGGKAQLNAALKVLKELNIASIDLMGLAKHKARHDKGLSPEKVFLPYQKKPLLIDPKSPCLFLLQKIRDEAHRVALGFHRRKRSKNFL